MPWGWVVSLLLLTVIFHGGFAVSFDFSGRLRKIFERLSQLLELFHDSLSGFQGSVDSVATMVTACAVPARWVACRLSAVATQLITAGLGSP